MKPEHEKVAVTECMPGSQYRVSMHGQDLYIATVQKFHGGCWATMRVDQAIDGPMASQYRPGMEFDIKVAQYTLYPHEEA